MHAGPRPCSCAPHRTDACKPICPICIDWQSCVSWYMISGYHRRCVAYVQREYRLSCLVNSLCKNTSASTEAHSISWGLTTRALIANYPLDISTYSIHGTSPVELLQKMALEKSEEEKANADKRALWLAWKAPRLLPRQNDNAAGIDWLSADCGSFLVLVICND